MSLSPDTKHYIERKICLMCKNNDFEVYFKKDFQSCMSFTFQTSNEKGLFLPFNIVACRRCKTVQTKYIGDIRLIYKHNHVDAFGSTKQRMMDAFASFVMKDIDVTEILEVGTPTSHLADAIRKIRKVPYTIVEPDFHGDPNDLQIISSFFEDVEISKLKSETLVMSHLFEHLYNPLEILKKIQESHIQRIYLNHPSFEYYCKKNVFNILNIEHISYFELEFLIQLFGQYEFQLTKTQNYEDHSIFLSFQRQKSNVSREQPCNKSSIEDTKAYFERMFRKIAYVNTLLDDPTQKVYLWPASAHNITLLTMGLHYEKLQGLLDNSPEKIGKVLPAYNLPCFSFQEKSKDDCTIVIGCSGNYIKELDLQSSKTNILFLEDV